MTMHVQPVSPAGGAHITGVDVAALDDMTFGAIEREWHRAGFLLLRDQRLTDDDLLAFSRRLGELDPPPNQERGRITPPGYPDIYVISNVLDQAGEPIGALGAGEAVWHTDMSYLEEPPMASMLYALEVPARGGNTWFCNMYAAWDAMPDALRAKLHGKRIKHDGTYNSGGYLRQGVAATDDPLQAPGAWHPAICLHPDSKRPALYLGRRRNSYVEGMNAAESAALLDEVWAHATQPQFTYSHHWRVGDLVLWDNRVTMHRRDAFSSSDRRIMHRTQIKGAHKPQPYFGG